MDFDHLDPSKKMGNISDFVKLGSFAKIRAEIAKCDVVCAVCHRIRTHKLKQYAGVALVGEHLLRK